MKRLAWGAVWSAIVVLMVGCGSAADDPQALALGSWDVSANADASRGQSQEGPYSEAGDDLPATVPKGELKEDRDDDDRKVRIVLAHRLRLQAGESLALEPTLEEGLSGAGQVRFVFELVGGDSNLGRISDDGVYEAPLVLAKKEEVQIRVWVANRPEVPMAHVEVHITP